MVAFKKPSTRSQSVRNRSPLFVFGALYVVATSVYANHQLISHLLKFPGANDQHDSPLLNIPLPAKTDPAAIQSAAALPVQRQLIFETPQSIDDELYAFTIVDSIRSVSTVPTFADGIHVFDYLDVHSPSTRYGAQPRKLYLDGAIVPNVNATSSSVQQMAQVLQLAMDSSPAPHFFYVAPDHNLCVGLGDIVKISDQYKRYLINSGQIDMSGWIMSRQLAKEMVNLVKKQPGSTLPDVIRLIDTKWSVTRRYLVSPMDRNRRGWYHLAHCLEPHRAWWADRPGSMYDAFGWGAFNYTECPDEDIYPCHDVHEKDAEEARNSFLFREQQVVSELHVFDDYATTGEASPLQSQDRVYSLHPVTAKESAFLTRQDDSGLRAAVCHPTIHGDGGLDVFFAWASYYRLLGFDHIFMWYLPHIGQFPRFEEFAALPYVTLTEWDGVDKKGYFGQTEVEESCLSKPEYARTYDWVLVLDADEYIWFDGYRSVKQFLLPYHEFYTYLSFGKYMYTMVHAYNDCAQNGFRLDRYPFTAGSYCFEKDGELASPRDACPTWLGRCKVMVKPGNHTKTNIHGFKDYHLKPDGLQVKTGVAHIKEWILLHRPPLNYIIRPTKESFYVTKDSEVVTHYTMQAHNRTKVGNFEKVEFYYDEQLGDWFSFVAHGSPKQKKYMKQQIHSIPLHPQLAAPPTKKPQRSFRKKVNLVDRAAEMEKIREADKMANLRDRSLFASSKFAPQRTMLREKR